MKLDLELTVPPPKPLSEDSPLRMDALSVSEPVFSLSIPDLSLLTLQAPLNAYRSIFTSCHFCKTRTQRKTHLWKGHMVICRTGQNTSRANCLVETNEFASVLNTLVTHLFTLVYSLESRDAPIHSKLDPLTLKPRGFRLFCNFQFN